MFRQDSGLSPDALRAWIDRHGWTRAEAARELGIGSTTLYGLLAGDRTIPQSLAKLMDALDRLHKVPA
jgi:transcriptional regulator with XRE-family HTH domain